MWRGQKSSDFPCPCMSLRTGALFVAVFQVTAYCCRLMLTLVALSMIPTLQKRWDDNISNNGTTNGTAINGTNIIGTNNGTVVPSAATKEVINAAYAFGTVEALSSVLGLFIALMLYSGIRRSNYRLMLAWIIMETMNVTFQLITLFIPYSHPYLSYYYFPWDILMILLRIYFLTIVYAHYEQLKTAEIFSAPTIIVAGPIPVI